MPMKVFLSIKYHEDHANREHIEQVCDVLAQRGCETFCVARDLEEWGRVAFTPGELMRRTFTALEACDLVLVDLSEKGVGVGIEAGYAHARSMPLAAMARRGRDISATLQGLARQVFWYDDAADIARLLVIPDGADR
jgi:2'-deoxynucleoside 5'-phosphate N-hydrolase